MNQDFLPWTKKYAPLTINDVKGQENSLKELIDFIKKFKTNQKKKSIIIYGSTGSGKTSSVYAIAEDLNMEIFEINSSDFRDSNSILATVGNAIKQVSLFGKKKIILIDDIDGMSGTKDRGGISTINKIIQESKFPVVLTATDPFSQKMKDLRKKSILIQFSELDHKNISEILKKICEKEKIKYDEKAINTLSRMAGGDVRAAINDLQILCTNTKKLTNENVLTIYERYKQETILQALTKIFKPNKLDFAMNAFDNVDENLDKIFLWVDNNLPREYKKPTDLKTAYEWLSLADLYNHRIRKRQHWRFLSYIYTFLSGGIAISKKEPIRTFTKYEQGDRILKLWIGKNRNAIRNSISERIAEKIHTSKKEAMQDVLPYIRMICKNNQQECNNICEYFEIEGKEKDWLKK